MANSGGPKPFEVLVTGGAGFIGSAVVDRATRSPYAAAKASSENGAWWQRILDHSYRLDGVDIRVTH